MRMRLASFSACPNQRGARQNFTLLAGRDPTYNVEPVGRRRLSDTVRGTGPGENRDASGLAQNKD